MNKAEQYRHDAEKRLAERERTGPPVPDFALASSYDPARDGTQTPAQLAEAQRGQQMQLGGEASPPGRPLSAQTIAGLEHIKSTADAQRAAAMPPQPKQEEEKKPAEEEVKRMLEGVDNLDAGQLIKKIQTDVINNKEVREAVEALLAPIDLGEGIRNNEFTQRVPIADGLSVTYRSTTPEETRQLRVLLFDMTIEDPRLEFVSDEIYGLMLIVASTTQINDTKFPSHLDGNSWDSTFNKETFTQKFKRFSRLPDPLIHAVGVHATWFDVRVRKAFRPDAVKNG